MCKSVVQIHTLIIFLRNILLTLRSYLSHYIKLLTLCSSSSSILVVVMWSLKVVWHHIEAGFLVSACSIFRTGPLMAEMAAHIHPCENITRVSNTLSLRTQVLLHRPHHVRVLVLYHTFKQSSISMDSKADVNFFTKWSLHVNLLGSSSSSMDILVSRMASLLSLLKLYDIVLRLVSLCLRVQCGVVTSSCRMRRVYSWMFMLIPVKISQCFLCRYCMYTSNVLHFAM